MKRLLVVLLLLLVLAAGGAYYYFQFNPPERYSTNEVYLLRYASVMTPGGVYGYPPGTRLTLDPTRRAAPGTVAVTDGTRRMDVETDALTRNPKIAQQLADADRQGQTQAVAGVVAAKAHVARVQSEAQMARAKDIDRLNAKQRGVILPPTPTPPRRTP